MSFGGANVSTALRPLSPSSPLPNGQLVDPDVIATTKHEEWVTKKKTDVTTTKQVETRVRRQLVVEDGRVLEDSGPCITTNTTENTETQEHEATEHRTSGEPPPGEDWVPVEGSVVKETVERKVNSHDEKKSHLETEEVQQLGNVSNDDIERVVRNGDDVRDLMIKWRPEGSGNHEKPYYVKPPVKRVIANTSKHDRITDTEDTREVNRINDEGNIVTEINTRQEHDEYHHSSGSDTDDDDERKAINFDTREGSHSYNHTKNEDLVEYFKIPKGGKLADGVKVGDGIHVVSEDFKEEKKGDWDPLEKRLTGVNSTQKRLLEGPYGNTSPADRRPLDFEAEEKARSTETVKWLQSHFGEDLLSPSSSTVRILRSPSPTMRPQSPSNNVQPPPMYRSTVTSSSRVYTPDEIVMSSDADRRTPTSSPINSRPVLHSWDNRMNTPPPNYPPPPPPPMHSYEKTKSVHQMSSAERNLSANDDARVMTIDENKKSSKKRLDFKDIFKRKRGTRASSPPQHPQHQQQQHSHLNSRWQDDLEDTGPPVPPPRQHKARQKKMHQQSAYNHSDNSMDRWRYRSSPVSYSTSHTQQPSNKFYLGEDPFNGSIYGRESQYPDTHPFSKQKNSGSKYRRKSPKPLEGLNGSAYNNYMIESSTLGRSRTSTDAIMQEMGDFRSKTLPRKLSRDRDDSSETRREYYRSDRTSSKPVSNGINVSIINTVRPHLNRSQSFNVQSSSPRRPYWSLNNDLSSKNSYDTKIHPIYKSNSCLDQLDEGASLKSPGLIRSLSRSQKELNELRDSFTNRKFSNTSPDRDTTAFSFDKKESLNSKKATFLRGLYETAPDLYMQLEGSSSSNKRAPPPPLKRPFSPPTSPSPIIQKSPLNHVSSFRSTGSSHPSTSSLSSPSPAPPATENFRETVRTRSKDGPYTTDTTKSYSRQSNPLETFESSETKRVTKGSTKDSYRNGPGSTFVNGVVRRPSSSASSGGVVIQVRDWNSR